VYAPYDHFDIQTPVDRAWRHGLVFLLRRGKSVKIADDSYKGIGL
jgi:hypothetical protein